VDNEFLSRIADRLEHMFYQPSTDRREPAEGAGQADAAGQADVAPRADEGAADGALDGLSEHSNGVSDRADGVSGEFDEPAAGGGVGADPERAVVDRLVAEIRADAAVIAAAEARRLRHVAELSGCLESEAVAILASAPRVPGAPPDQEVIDSAVDGEVQVVLGIGPGPAARLVHLARRLSTVLPRALDALESGRLDLTRVRGLVEATEVLPGQLAREVADQLLEVAGEAPWAGLSPRAWRARIERTVARVDADAARRRRREAHAARLVRSMPTLAGMAELIITADSADIAMAEQVLTDLAHARRPTGPDGDCLSIDQRRVDAFVEVFRRVRDGRDPPGVPVRRDRELGLVMHADTFFQDGPAANDPGEVRGLGQTAYLDPATAREQAHALVSPNSDGPNSDGPNRGGGTNNGGTNSDGPNRGGGTNNGGTNSDGPVAGPPGGSAATNVLLVDRLGALVRTVRLPGPPPGGWTRALLETAVTARLDHLPPLSCPGYAPTVAIEQHVRARNPRCTGYDCPRTAQRCDLDHDTPWPRGPTDVTNLDPRCRRQHEHKTRGLVHTRLQPDGALETTMMLTGLVITTRPEPLPGYTPGEGHAPNTRPDSPA
jgi:hypothetical protein